jgi:hypothetical protein
MKKKIKKQVAPLVDRKVFSGDIMLQGRPKID